MPRWQSEDYIVRDLCALKIDDHGRSKEGFQTVDLGFFFLRLPGDQERELRTRHTQGGNAKYSDRIFFFCHSPKNSDNRRGKIKTAGH